MLMSHTVLRFIACTSAGVSVHDAEGVDSVDVAGDVDVGVMPCVGEGRPSRSCADACAYRPSYVHQ